MRPTHAMRNTAPPTDKPMISASSSPVDASLLLLPEEPPVTTTAVAEPNEGTVVAKTVSDVEVTAELKASALVEEGQLTIDVTMTLPADTVTVTSPEVIWS